MKNVVLVLLTVCLILSCSDKNKSLNNENSINVNINEAISINSEIQRTKSINDEYFIYDFWNNPFLDYQFQPDYFGENIVALLKNEHNALEITEIRIENIDWINGYYFKTQIKNDDFETYYLSPYDKSSYRRPLLVITGNKIKLKSNIYIGMDRDNLISIIENNDQNSHVEYNDNKIVVTIEEVWVYFILSNDLLNTIEIQVGT